VALCLCGMTVVTMIDSILLEVLWKRLISIVNEQAPR
jgi:hypothetical protein